MSNALPPFSAKLLSSRPLGGGMRELCLEVPDEFCRASRPGMFVHLKVPDAPQHLLRRPISIMDLEPEDNLLVLGVQPKGEGTRLICSMRRADASRCSARSATVFRSTAPKLSGRSAAESGLPPCSTPAGNSQNPHGSPLPSVFVPGI